MRRDLELIMYEVFRQNKDEINRLRESITDIEGNLDSKLRTLGAHVRELEIRQATQTGRDRILSGMFGASFVALLQLGLSILFSNST